MTNQNCLSQTINGKNIEFYIDTHEYFVDGIQVPSVTQIVSTMLKSLYKHVDPLILKRAADKGIALHREIEQYEKEQILGQTREFKNYVMLKRKHQFQPLENEVLIYIEHQGKPIGAGRLDMIISSSCIDGIGIGDVKRTYNIYHEHIKLQLNLYALGYEQSYHKKINYLKCIHLRNYEANYLDVVLDQSYVLEQINAFIKSSLL